LSTSKPTNCKTPGCTKPHHAHGYCQKCYDNVRKRKRSAGGSGAHRGKWDPPDPKRKDGKQTAAEPPRAAKGKPAPAAPAGDKTAAPEAPKTTRVALLKARHEAMKREIDQIREDLAADEED
jgi:hypothetical protein